MANTPLHIITIILTIVLTAVCSSMAAAKPEAMPYFKADYQATIKGMPLTASRQFLAISSDVAELRFNADSWIASMDESAKFVWNKPQIKPLRFSHERKIVGKRDAKSLTFDWDNNKIVGIDGDEKYEMDNPEKALDHLSFQLQLQYDLLTNNIESSYRIADKKGFKQYHFEIVQDEVIDTELGKLNTVKVKVIRDQSNRLTYIWFAKNWSYLLVKMEQYEDGDKEFELQLTKATVAQQTVTGL